MTIVVFELYHQRTRTRVGHDVREALEAVHSGHFAAGQLDCIDDPLGKLSACSIGKAYES